MAKRTKKRKKTKKRRPAKKSAAKKKKKTKKKKKAKKKKKTSKKKSKKTKKKKKKKKAATKKKRSKKKPARKKAKAKAKKKKPALQALPPPADFKNQRKFPRVPVNIKIDYFRDPGVFLYDYSRNLGRGGIFIETENPMETGTELTLSFTLPHQDKMVQVNGKVVWVHYQESKPGGKFKGLPGMGVQFVNPQGEHKEALDRFFREIDYDNLSF